MSARFQAMYDGECDLCGDSFSEGDEIGYLDEDIACDDCMNESESEIEFWA